jgi:L-cysteine desulfidase
MDTNKNMDELYEILKKETKPAFGCTGPIGACYAAAEAYDAIGGEIKKIIVEGAGPKCDDVAFPGSEMLGVEMAYALGAVCGDAKAGLEVLHHVTPEGELKARKVAELVELITDSSAKTIGTWYEKVTIETDKGVGVAVCEGAPDALVYKARNGEVLITKAMADIYKAGKSPLMKYKIKDFFEFASGYPYAKLSFLLEARDFNLDMSVHTLENASVGTGIGRSLMDTPNPNEVTRAKAYAAAGCEGRMYGEAKTIMSVGGKGNVGIAVTMPIVSLAKDMEASDEQLVRALALSCIMAIAVIHRIGKAPTMCSCEVAASMGVASGIVLLKGGTAKQAEMAIQNLIPSVFGVVCDGAKPACALRLASSTGIALDAAALALKGIQLAKNQGVLDENADASVDFLGDFALNAMIESDKELCARMMNKRKIFPLQSIKDRDRATKETSGNV